jgi:hypothetical protein
MASDSTYLTARDRTCERSRDPEALNILAHALQQAPDRALGGAPFEPDALENADRHECQRHGSVCGQCSSGVVSGVAGLGDDHASATRFSDSPARRDGAPRPIDGESRASQARIAPCARERNQWVHDAHRGTARLASPKLVGSPSACTMEHGRAWAEVRRDRTGNDLDRVIGNREDDNVGALNVRGFPAATCRDDVVKPARFRRPPKGAPDSAAADDQDVHRSPW